MRTLVTGGAGFIGSHLTQELLKRGHEVRVIDSLITGKRANLSQVAGDIEFVEADLRDDRAAAIAVKGCDLIFHQAALPSVPRSIVDPQASVDNNVGGTVSLLKAAVDAGVRRIVYAGSSSAYGNCDKEKKNEKLMPQVLSPYAAGKLACEYLLQSFRYSYGLETVVVRYFNVFGERQDAASQYSGVIAKFIKLMLAGKQPTINGDGEHSRDFTYVQNVVEGNLLAAGAAADRVSGEVFNIACGGNISLQDLVHEINDILGREIAPHFGPPRNGDIRHSRADISKAIEVLGFRPTVHFREGLVRTIDWYFEQSEMERFMPRTAQCPKRMSVLMQDGSADDQMESGGSVVGRIRSHKTS